MQPEWQRREWVVRPKGVVLSYAAAHDRDLHSFPTRRSSDLPGPRKGVMPGVRALLDELAKRQDVYLALDRKSTRLNSSHVSISYAVFCLKKKKPSPTLVAADCNSSSESFFPAVGCTPRVIPA